MQGIEQWNKSNYWACYPKEYYVQSIEDKKLYVLKQIEDNQVVGAVVLSSCDKRWKDDDKALYLHNFVTSIDAQNAGSSILEFCSELAQRSGKAYLRLDCAISNKILNDYYEAKGFVYVEPIIDGAYKGVKREKKLI